MPDEAELTRVANFWHKLNQSVWQEHVTVLDDASVDAWLTKNPAALAMMYSPYCGAFAASPFGCRCTSSRAQPCPFVRRCVAKCQALRRGTGSEWTYPTAGCGI